MYQILSLSMTIVGEAMTVKQCFHRAPPPNQPDLPKTVRKKHRVDKTRNAKLYIIMYIETIKEFGIQNDKFKYDFASHTRRISFLMVLAKIQDTVFFI